MCSDLFWALLNYSILVKGLYSRMSDTWDIGTLKNFGWEPIKQSTSNTIH